MFLFIIFIKQIKVFDLFRYETGGNTQVTQSLTNSNSTTGASKLCRYCCTFYLLLICHHAGSANWKTLSEIKSENLGSGEKPDYVTAKVTVLYCKKENVLYQVVMFFRQRLLFYFFDHGPYLIYSLLAEIILVQISILTTLSRFNSASRIF